MTDESDTPPPLDGAATGEPSTRSGEFERWNDEYEAAYYANIWNEITLTPRPSAAMGGHGFSLAGKGSSIAMSDEYDATNCDDCGKDVYIDANGDLYDDDEGEKLHDIDCAAEDDDDRTMEEVRAYVGTFVDALDGMDVSDLSAVDRRNVNLLLKRARAVLGDD